MYYALPICCLLQTIVLCAVVSYRIVCHVDASSVSTVEPFHDDLDPEPEPPPLKQTPENIVGSWLQHKSPHSFFFLLKKKERVEKTTIGASCCVDQT